MAKSKKNKAVALKYKVEEDSAPVVIASGYGHIAQKIVEIAETQGIPVFRDDSAASLLCMLEVGRQIPPELYEIIAAIYASILRISGEIKHTDDKPVQPLDTSMAASRIQARLEQRRRAQAEAQAKARAQAQQAAQVEDWDDDDDDFADA